MYICSEYFIVGLVVVVAGLENEKAERRSFQFLKTKPSRVLRGVKTTIDVDRSEFSGNALNENLESIIDQSLRTTHYYDEQKHKVQMEGIIRRVQKRAVKKSENIKLARTSTRIMTERSEDVYTNVYTHVYTNDGIAELKEKRKDPVGANMTGWVDEAIRTEIEKLRKELSVIFLENKGAFILAEQIEKDRKNGMRRMEEMKSLNEEGSRVKMGILVAVLLAICLFLVGFYAVTKPAEREEEDEDNGTNI